MENRWTFRALNENACDVEFFIDYEFRSRILAMLMGAMFEAAFRRFAAAFEKRADQVYRRKVSDLFAGRAVVLSFREVVQHAERLQNRELSHLGAADIAVALLDIDQPARPVGRREKHQPDGLFLLPPSGPAMPVIDTAIEPATGRARRAPSPRRFAD